jgi:hypothetical protein
MAFLVADCPRCGSKSMTFDVLAQVYIDTLYKWQNWYEIFCRCRACRRPTDFVVSLSEITAKDTFYQSNGLVRYEDTLNPYFKIERFISLRDNVSTKPPEHVEGQIKDVFIEGAACLSIECCNAAATMFRLCVDVATRPRLAACEDGAKPKIHEPLGRRLKWMFDNKILPSELRGLASCIKDDGNDGAHAGTLKKEDAEDLLDFTTALLERLITEPKRLELAEERRKDRRAPKSEK